jgi:hypothetical protein
MAAEIADHLLDPRKGPSTLLVRSHLRADDVVKLVYPR